MKTKLLVIVQLLWLSVCFSQNKEGYNWITGTTDCRVSFNTTDTMPIVFKVINYNTFFLDGTSCISDSNGNFLFSCDGFRIWDTLGNIMDNGDSLCPKKIMDQDIVSPYTQASLILPFSDDIYYIFTPTVSDTTHDTYWHNTSGIAPFDLLLYHKVDMKENAGAGKVIKKAFPLIQNRFISKSQMQACRHSNGTDWWLIKQALDSNIVYKFLITKDSIYGPFVQNFAPYRFGIVDNYGQACFSKRGTKYAVVQPDVPPSSGIGGLHDNAQLLIADFNRCNGEITNPIYFNIPNLTSYNSYIDSFYGGLGDHGGNGICFSENDKYLYISKFFNIMQFELAEPDSSLAWFHVAGLDTSFFAFERYQGMYLAPDHKIYIGNVNGGSKQMSVINKPDNKGNLSEFCPKCLRFPFTGINSPPNMPNFGLGADTTSICWPLDIRNVKEEIINQKIKVYPNPANTEIFIEYNCAGEGDFALYNVLGEIVLHTGLSKGSTKVLISILNISPGLYTYHCNVKGCFIEKGKLSITK